MLENLMNAIIENLTQLMIFTQVEPYEGQFDNLDEYVIKPPSCFIEFTAGRPDNALTTSKIVNIDFFIVTSHIKGKLNIPMLNIIEILIEKFNNTRLAKGYMHFNAFERLAIFPGFCSYRLSFEFKEDL
jgi:hypothetical protein